MKCTAKLCSVLPERFRRAIAQEEWDCVTEIRLRLGRPGVIVMPDRVRQMEETVNQEDLQWIVNTASHYSPWSAGGIREGYLTAPGGHRIGLCGEWMGNGFRSIRSVCIRAAKDLRGIADGIPIRDSILILGPPGSGKTTLLRELIRRIAVRWNVAVVDERREVFPAGFDSAGADVLWDCPKPQGIPMVLRTMGPGWIAVDEITEAADCSALIQAGWCGVKLIATAHAAGVADLLERPVYKPLVETKLFRTAVVLDMDRQWHMERI